MMGPRAGLCSVLVMVLPMVKHGALKHTIIGPLERAVGVVICASSPRQRKGDGALGCMPNVQDVKTPRYQNTWHVQGRWETLADPAA